MTLRDIFSKRKKSENFWFTFYYFCSTFIVWIALQTKWHPNQITIGGLSINILAAAFFLLSPLSGTTVIVTYVLFNTAHILDCADGHLAFVANLRSEKGAWLDSSLDIFKIALVTGCYIKMIHGLTDTYGETLVSFVVLISLGNLINYTTSLAANSYRERIDHYRNEQSHLFKTLSDYGLQSRLAGAILSNLREYGNFLLIFAIFALSPTIGAALICIWGALQWVFALNRVRSIFKQLE